MERPVVETARWSLAQRVGFRFVCLYSLLYFFPFPFTLLPRGGVAAGWYDDVWDGVARRLWDAGFLHYSEELVTATTGSGDRTVDWLRVGGMLAIALVGTLVWSAVDYRRRAYVVLHELLRIYLRYALAFIMLTYGFSKVFKSQFPTPGPDRLIQSFGEASPMGLLWTFMGASTAYTIFAGAGEVIGGLLLLSRHTMMLGATVVVGVMANVVMMNFSYDVPVKQYSTHLLLVAIFLMLPDTQRLLNFLVLNRPVAPARLRPRWSRLWMRITEWVFKAVVVGYIVFIQVYGGYKGWKTWGDGAPTPALYGLYEVESFTLNGTEVPPLITESNRWRRVAVNRSQRVTVEPMRGPMSRFSTVKLDPDTHLLTRQPRLGGSPIVVEYAEPESGALTLQGKFGEDTISARLRKVETSEFMLMNRGFHWISEYPYNR